MKSTYDRAEYAESAEKRLEWIKSLVEVSKQPKMRLATTVKGKDGFWHPGGRITLKEYEKCGSTFIPDYYTVRCGQVIFDQDAPWEHPEYGVKVLAKKTVEALRSLDIPYLIFDTGGKGIHTYAFYKLPENKKLLEKANEKGIMPRDLRMLIFKIVCDTAGVPENYRGVGKPQDTACINFIDTSGMGRLIRCPGGRKIDKEGRLIGYKTLIDKIPEQKTLVKKFTDVFYPTKNDIKLWTLPEIIFSNFIEDFKLPQKQGAQTQLKEYRGMLLNAPCSLSLRLNGAPVGERSWGAKALAVFCVGDGLDYYEAMELLAQYYNRCDPTDFDLGEVRQWCRWAYDDVVQNPDKYIHCGHMRIMKLCDKEHCVYYQKIREERARERRNEVRKRLKRRTQPPQLKPYSQPPKQSGEDKRAVKRKRRGKRKEDEKWREKIMKQKGEENI